MSNNILKIGARYDSTGCHWQPEPNRAEGFEIEQGDGAMFVTVADRCVQNTVTLTIEESRELAMWILQKTGGVTTPAPVGAKLCTQCGDHNLVNFRTIQHASFDKPGYRHCSGCGHDMPWHLENGQPALLGSHRATAKTVKSDE